ncbi:hypothetical protein COV11_02250 [Candidatus Woesearchaeota archaeon CG10_big_fil_rev_8_21_14_0_10_30_7]|nr:MAG: hypothetical protein COV11_02250 [Candidatus Woesearchaeota archaeon CG10_big_fil_rev_8_21_14_0_10_30_7]
MIEELKAIGLTTYQSRALEVIFKNNLSLKELSKIANIPPGKVYSIAKQLIDKGLIKCTRTRPKKLYVENASEIISKLTNNQETKLGKVISTLQDFGTLIDTKENRSTPFFDLGTTIEDNRRIQMRTFVESENEVLQIINIHHKPKYNRQSKTLWETAIINATQKGVIFKSIYPKKVILPKILNDLSKKHPDKFQVRRLDTNFTRCDIIDGKNVLIKLVHEDALAYGGILFIKNKKFAENLKEIFYKFWSEAEK